jgi:hypothetical protein
MNPQHVPRTASRARWLTALAAALDEAQLLLTQLAAERIGDPEAAQLRLRIEELRAELQSLHRRGFAAEEEVEAPHLVHPDWQPRRG